MSSGATIDRGALEALMRTSEGCEMIRDAAHAHVGYCRNQAPLWFHRAYADLCHSADVLAAFLKREEQR